MFFYRLLVLLLLPPPKCAIQLEHLFSLVEGTVRQYIDGKIGCWTLKKGGFCHKPLKKVGLATSYYNSVVIYCWTLCLILYSFLISSHTKMMIMPLPLYLLSFLAQITSIGLAGSLLQAWPSAGDDADRQRSTGNGVRNEQTSTGRPLEL